jgi:uncharacterized membrane protein (DUF2068 family)
MPRRDSHGSGMLRLIAAFKLAKGVLLLVLGLATLSFRHRDVTAALGTWVDQLHLDPGGRLVRAALLYAADLRPRRLVAIAAGMLAYAVLLLVEGTGLWLDRRWGEYFAVIITASFLPLEVYELVRHPTPTRLTVLAVNVAIVVYLVRRLRHAGRRR